MAFDWSIERENRVANIAVILSGVYLALVTWSGLSGSAGIALWKAYFAVLATMFLALASLTRHPRWGVWFRLLMVGWIIVTPYLLAFADQSRLSRSYLMIGILLAAVSMPGVSGILGRRVGMAVIAPLQTVRVARGSPSSNGA